VRWASSSGVAGRITGTLGFDVTGFSFSAGLGLAINTSPVARTVGGADLPAGPYVRFDATNITLKIGDAELLGDFSFERATLADGTTSTAIAARNVHFAVGTVAVLDGGRGALLITAGGLAGRLEGSVALHLPGDAAFTGTFALAVNTGHAAVDDLPGGPYVRIAATGVKLTIAGQTLEGDFGFEQITSFGADGRAGGGDDSKVTRLALANLNITLGGGVLTVRDGSGTLLIKSDGIAGDFGGTIALNVPNVLFTGTLRVQVNTTPGEVHDTFDEIYEAGWRLE